MKELIISNAPLNYEGSIRRAFPELVYFCAQLVRGSLISPAVWELMLISKELKDIILYQEESFPALPDSNIVFTALSKIISSVFRTAKLYPDLLNYLRNRSAAENCQFGFKVKFGANLSKISVNGFLLLMKTEKPICIEEENNLTYLDLGGSLMSNSIPVFSGLKNLKYLSLENTGIKNVPYEFLRHYPVLEVLKLSQVDIGNFVANINEEFFGSCPTLSDVDLHGCNISKVPTAIFSHSVNLQRLDMSHNLLTSFDFYLQNCTKLNILNLSYNSIKSTRQGSIIQLTQLASRKTEGNNLVIDLSHNRLHCLCNSTHFIKWLQRSPADSHIDFHDFDSYMCLYPNGTTVRVSEVVVSDLEQQCRVIITLVNRSDCPCDGEQRRRLEQVYVHLDGFFCRNDEGVFVPMKNQPWPSCFSPYKRASFISPVVVGGILAITVFITAGMMIYYRNTKRVRQVREYLEMNPVRFIQAAIQYVLMSNHHEEQTRFQYNVMLFVQEDERGHMHGNFIEALQGSRSLITPDVFAGGASVVDALQECIHRCRWIVMVLTANFLSDPACTDVITRVQFSRPHALIPVVWEESLKVTDVSVAEMLRTGDPLYWPGDQAAPENKHHFWATLLERTASD